MHVWQIHLGETLPIDGPVRLFRYGLLAEQLLAEGHRVTRWAPTFAHTTKTFRCHGDQTIEVADRHQLELLEAGGYHRHVGLKRLLFTRRLAQAFARRLRACEPPDVIVAAIPSPELAELAVDYGRRRGIPVVVDVRDLWPSILVDHFPSVLRPLCRLALSGSFRSARRALSGADALYAVSGSYLNWGLSFARRPARETDRVVPLAYKRPSISADQQLEAERFWDNQGVTKERGLRCCYFGSMNSTCDISTVVESARRLSSTNPEIDFVICGEGPFANQLREAASGLNNLRFAGWVDQPEISVLMQRSDIGLAAYAAGAPQSLPNKPIEYLAGGLQVVSSLPGELEKLLDQTKCGAHYRAGDAEHLTAKLLEYNNTASQQRVAMRRRSEQLYRCEFDASQVYAQMAERLCELSQTRAHNKPASQRAA